MKEFLKSMVQKLTSRKFWVTATTVAAGISIALGASSGDLNTATSTAQVVVGGLMTVIPGVAYLFSEGKIDAARASKGISDINTIIEALKKFFDDVPDDNEEA